MEGEITTHFGQAYCDSGCRGMRRELDNHGQQTLQADKMAFAELVAAYDEARLVEATYENGIKVSGKRSIAPVRSSLSLLLQYFGKRVIRTIKASNIESYKRERLQSVSRRGTTIKIATVNRELALLRSILNFAVQNEWLIRNPFILAKGLISVSAETERSRILSFEEESRLLSVCTGSRRHLKALLVCALDTAMRRGEMFKMKWIDVDFVRDGIYIPQTNTKTEEARIVGITPRLRSELLGLWEASPKDSNGLVFGITNTIKTAFGSACKEAGIEDFRFHDCRHTATTRMIASGSPHTEVMKITGHSQMKTFLRYLNITTDRANSVASRLHGYLADRVVTSEVVSDRVN